MYLILLLSILSVCFCEQRVLKSKNKNNLSQLFLTLPPYPDSTLTFSIRPSLPTLTSVRVSNWEDFYFLGNLGRKSVYGVFKYYLPTTLSCSDIPYKPWYFCMIFIYKEVKRRMMKLPLLSFWDIHVLNFQRLLQPSVLWQWRN